MKWFLLFIISFVARLAVAEPAYCSEKYLRDHEVKIEMNIKRLHAYQIGKLELIGLPVGSSDPNEVARISKAPAARKYCTWYWNEGNDKAEEMFTQHYLPGPYEAWFNLLRTQKGIAKDYEIGVGILNADAIVKCAEDYGYVAGGCDGQKHRGPSVFAFILSLSGCDPKTSTDIADDVWGLNGVPYNARLAIAQKGMDYGNEHPELRSRLQKVMLGQ